MTEKIIFSSESEADKLIRILKDIHECQEEEKKKVEESCILEWLAKSSVWISVDKCIHLPDVQIVPVIL